MVVQDPYAYNIAFGGFLFFFVFPFLFCVEVCVFCLFCLFFFGWGVWNPTVRENKLSRKRTPLSSQIITSCSKSFVDFLFYFLFFKRNARKLVQWWRNIRKRGKSGKKKKRRIIDWITDYRKGVLTQKGLWGLGVGCSFFGWGSKKITLIGKLSPHVPCLLPSCT